MQLLVLLWPLLLVVVPAVLRLSSPLRPLFLVSLKTAGRDIALVVFIVVDVVVRVGVAAVYPIANV